jgi:hypothetical protein
MSLAVLSSELSTTLLERQRRAPPYRKPDSEPIRRDTPAHTHFPEKLGGGTPWPAKSLPVPLVVALIGAHASDTAPAWAKTVRVAA